MSSFPPRADIRQPEWHVRYVPEAEVGCSIYAHASKSYGVLPNAFGLWPS